MSFKTDQKYVRKDDQSGKKIYVCRVSGHMYDGVKRLYYMDANGNECGVHISMLRRCEFKEKK